MATVARAGTNLRAARFSVAYLATDHRLGCRDAEPYTAAPRSIIAYSPCGHAHSADARPAQLKR